MPFLMPISNISLYHKIMLIIKEVIKQREKIDNI